MMGCTGQSCDHGVTTAGPGDVQWPQRGQTFENLRKTYLKPTLRPGTRRPRPDIRDASPSSSDQ